MCILKVVTPLQIAIDQNLSATTFLDGTDLCPAEGGMECDNYDIIENTSDTDGVSSKSLENQNLLYRKAIMGILSCHTGRSLNSYVHS